MVKKLDIETVEEIYNKYLVHDFPANEVKPLENIKTMWEMDGYEAYGYYDEGILKAYAFMCKEPSSRFVLLDYLAVVSDLRGQGIGSSILKNLKMAMRDELAIIIETEDALKAINQEQKDERNKRDKFYERNGVIKSGFSAAVYSADYRVWYVPLDESVDEEDIYDAYHEIYRFMLSERGYCDHFKVTIAGVTE